MFAYISLYIIIFDNCLFYGLNNRNVTLGMLINNLKDGVKELKVENRKQAKNVTEIKNLLMKIKLQSCNLVFFSNVLT